MLREIETWLVNLIKSQLKGTDEDIRVSSLADSIDSEGSVSSASQIVVSFSGYSNSDTENFPLIVSKNIQYRIFYYFQNYTSIDGHHRAYSILERIENALSGKSPLRSGLEIITPCYVSSTEFDGLTDSSQYVYIQTVSLSATQTYPEVVLDPCVAAGNCEYQWPPDGVITDEDNLPPGYVILPDGSVLLPCPPDGIECEPRTYTQGQDLYLCDGTLLITDWLSGDRELVLHGKMENGRYRVDVFQISTGEFISSLNYCPTGIVLAQVDLSLYVENPEAEDLAWQKRFRLRGGTNALTVIPTSFSPNPLSENLVTSTLEDGTVVTTTSTEILHNEERWLKVYVRGIPGWIKIPEGNTITSVLKFIDKLATPCE